jgi:hypothetical protein
MMEKDRTRRLMNQERLRNLSQEQGRAVTIFSSHDPVEFERLAGLPLATPRGLALAR